MFGLVRKCSAPARVIRVVSEDFFWGWQIADLLLSTGEAPDGVVSFGRFWIVVGVDSRVMPFGNLSFGPDFFEFDRRDWLWFGELPSAGGGTEIEDVGDHGGSGGRGRQTYVLARVAGWEVLRVWRG